MICQLSKVKSEGRCDGSWQIPKNNTGLGKEVVVLQDAGANAILKKTPNNLI